MLMWSSTIQPFSSSYSASAFSKEASSEATKIPHLPMIQLDSPRTLHWFFCRISRPYVVPLILLHSWTSWKSSCLFSKRLGPSQWSYCGTYPMGEVLGRNLLPNCWASLCIMSKNNRVQNKITKPGLVISAVFPENMSKEMCLAFYSN